MTDEEYKRIAEQILAEVKQQSPQYSAVDIVERLAQSDAPEEKVRAAMLNLLDRGQIHLTSDLKLSTSPVC